MRIPYMLLQVLLVASAALTAHTAFAQQDYPNRPIRLVVPYPPGGGITPIARLYADKLAEAWGQPVVVDNRGGGNTVIGSDNVAKSPPDGYTLFLTQTTHVLVPLLLQAPYDPIKDFTPVASIAAGEQLMVVPASLPVNTLQEFIGMAKANPGKLNYGSAGNGTINHLSSERFKMLAGVDIQHVPYKGGGPAITDLLGGRIEMYSAVPLSLIPHVQSGKVKPIAVSGNKRFSGLPNVPTFAEAGLVGFDARVGYWILAPAGTPKAIVDKASSELARISNLPATKEALAQLGLEPLVMNPEQLAAAMKGEMANFAQVVKAANIKLDN